MRLASLLRKSLVEAVREWKILLLTLSLAPFFVVLMAVYYENAPERCRVAVVNGDEGAPLPGGGRLDAGKDLVAALAALRTGEGPGLLEVATVRDADAARRRVARRAADLAVVIPPDFSRVLADRGAGGRGPAAVIRIHGDPANLKYVMALAWCDRIATGFAASVTGMTGPVAFRAEGAARGRPSPTEFDLCVPALLAFSLMMLMFTAAGALIREKDKGTLVRLRISNARVWEWLLAEGAVQALLGLLACGLTLGTAVAAGYEASGSGAALLVVALLSGVSIVAISVIVAAFIGTVFDLWTVGCFPFFVLMFFSGGMVPLPDIRLFTLGGRVVNANALLPTTHSISAFNRILNHGAGLADVGFELAAIGVLTAALLAAGVHLFRRRHMRRA